MTPGTRCADPRRALPIGRLISAAVLLLAALVLLLGAPVASAHPPAGLAHTPASQTASRAASPRSRPAPPAPRPKPRHAGPSDALGQPFQRPKTPPHLTFHAGPTIAPRLTGTVLILDTTVSGGMSSLEAQAAESLGLSVEDDDASAWASKTTADFASYRAIIFGDPYCSSPADPYLQPAEANPSAWGPAVTGNVVVIGTDPVYHAAGQLGAATMIVDGIGFAASQSGHTGAYIDLSCYYYQASAGTPVPVLDAISPAGSFTVVGQGSCPEYSHVVAVSPAISGISDGQLSNWSCSTHEAFTSWPSSFTPVAITLDVPSSYIAPDGTNGAPYIMVDVASGPQPLGGPTGSETYGNYNPSENSCSCTYVDPVDSFTGNFAYNVTDDAIPSRGIPLAFSRTYNALAAATAGSLGYGWTDSYNWALVVDGSGNVTIQQENGSTVTFTPGSATSYIAPSRVLASLIKNGDGSYTFTRNQDQTRYTFSSVGKLTAETNRNGYATTLAYDGSGHLASVTDPAGRSLTFTNDGSGRITKVSDPGGRIVVFTYDGSGNLASATDVAGGVTSYTYDANHLLLTITDPLGHKTTNTYDGSSRVVSQSDPMNRTTTFSYAAGSGTASTTTITDPRGIVTVDQYESGLLVSQTQASGTAQQAVWSYVYDLVTLGVAKITDPNGNITEQLWDPNGNMISRTDSLGYVTSYTYDALNDLTSKTDPLGVTTTYTYDANGNLLSVSAPLTSTGQTQTTTYVYGDSVHPGDVTAMTDALGKTWAYTYDSAGNRITSTDPLTGTTTDAYNILGQKTSETNATGNMTLFTYDAFGDLLTSKDALGDTNSTQYDGDRNRVSATDADGNLTQYAYDADNELTTTTRATATAFTYTYDADGNQTSVTDAASHTTSYTYDPLNRIASVTDPLGHTSTTTYDPAGNRIAFANAGGQTASYTYDFDNRLTSTTYSDGVTPAVYYGYDADGQRTYMSDGSGTTYSSYDSLHRLTSVVNGVGATVSYAYNLRGQVNHITYPDGNGLTRTYDNAGRLASVKDWLGHTTTYTYDPDGHLLGITYANGMLATNTYDAAGRLTAIQYAFHPIGPNAPNYMTRVATFGYSRDAFGLATSVQNSGPHGGPFGGQDQTYSYTPLQRISQVGGFSAIGYTYSSSDTITGIGSATLTYDAADELTQLAGGVTTNYTYDARGDRTQAVTGPAMTSLTYDEENRLTGYTTSTTSASYVYNGDGLRMSKTVNGGATEAFTWDTAEGSAPALLQDGTTDLVYGANGALLEQVASGGTVLFAHQDQLGSTRLLTDASGKQVAAYTYDAFGNLQAHTGSATALLQFAGQYLDAESGFYYLRARLYDPVTAQFLTRDPLQPFTLQPYAYAAFDPLNAWDPTGKIWLLSGVTQWFDDHASEISEVSGTIAAGASLVATGCSVAALFTEGTSLACTAIAGGISELATLVKTEADSQSDPGAVLGDELSLALGAAGMLSDVTGAEEVAKAWQEYIIWAGNGAQTGSDLVDFLSGLYHGYEAFERFLTPARTIVCY